MQRYIGFELRILRNVNNSKSTGKYIHLSQLAYNEVESKILQGWHDINWQRRDQSNWRFYEADRWCRHWRVFLNRWNMLAHLLRIVFVLGMLLIFYKHQTALNNVKVIGIRYSKGNKNWLTIEGWISSPNFIFLKLQRKISGSSLLHLMDLWISMLIKVMERLSSHNTLA